ncbi:hypothetical protein ACFFUT_09205 [Pseudohalocynthiibacter aestuariivivens]|uniref:Uncharacterized protein n=1 Tax=Pseudohalocynthiibacter aestuariivivens TaxID=1591409 RepID=A0ABV5JGH7_9RHOB|nr:hypothetical protein [Pseudohalocynthiibacter aestuariivivens]MBS9718510.1 hypothetical protein [Pseudohalocynthiibacter aestuariivivens]
MNDQNVQLWAAPTTVAISDTVSAPADIASAARQLRPREKMQITSNIDAGYFEMASTYVWARTMALLKKQLASVGMEFLGELLQRPDLDEYSDVATSLSDSEAVSLARDLGILTPVQTMRLMQSQETVSHFSALGNDPAEDHGDEMTREEAISCLRVCVQGVLGHESVAVAEDFKSFRLKLEAETFTSNSPEFLKLQSSPYFFLKTAVSILLSLFKSGKGAQLEHTARNAALIIPTYWDRLKAPERWQIGQAYAQEFSEGRKDSVKGLHTVLIAVKGFDYVPENLRSTTFIQVASSVISAHQGMNNFYNEPGPMNELASLGTSIPSPALAKCMTAVLCVKLGNYYGTSHLAQSPADKVIAGLSKERWYFYLNEMLVQDRVILSKFGEPSPFNNWMTLIGSLDLDASRLSEKYSKDLLSASIAKDPTKVQAIARRMLKESLG